jgi:ornithine cyclodeaminase/alanine dehydrogenase-like protein (mu-crystallin family)
MFDGVGIGIQDTTIVRTIYDQAVKQGLGQRIAFS